MQGVVDQMGGGKGIGKFKSIPTLSQSLRASRLRIHKGAKIPCTFIIIITGTEVNLQGEVSSLAKRKKGIRLQLKYRRNMLAC